MDCESAGLHSGSDGGGEVACLAAVSALVSCLRRDARVSAALSMWWVWICPCALVSAAFPVLIAAVRSAGKARGNGCADAGAPPSATTTTATVNRTVAATLNCGRATVARTSDMAVLLPWAFRSMTVRRVHRLRPRG